ncbi:MAG: hypothetical protein OXC46_03975 [Thaumarchaeota archaeon]|nr:hypothetical protein [Nitrososphaerota archaeon]
MPLCTIAPLEDEDWIILMKDLEKGQTEEQAEFVRKAIARASKLNVSYED